MRIALIANSAWYLYNFRRSFMRALRDAGHRPVVISPSDDYMERLFLEGIDCLEWPLDAAGVNPLRELNAVRQLHAMLRAGCIDAAFAWTPKANIYLGLAAQSLRLPYVPTVSGLGRVFIEESWLTPLVSTLYRRAFRLTRLALFENADDQRKFVSLGLVTQERTRRVAGAGVDLAHFGLAPLPHRTDGKVTFLFIGRILRDKGVVELVEAARQVKSRYPGAVFKLLGPMGVNNPTAISAQQVSAWVDEGVVEALGSTDDVRSMIADSDCVVLPSYREGVPRSLLEGAAMGRPCIATDVPGCRDAVDHGSSGLLCAVRDSAALTQAIEQFLAMPPAEREAMGLRGRAKVEREFDERIVLRTYVDLATSIAKELYPARLARAA